MTEKKIKADITIKDAKIDIKSDETLCNEKNCKKTFRKLLDKKTCENNCENKCETCKKKNNQEYPQECLLTLYLNRVIPDWRIMEDDRLYKHAQKVLDNIEGIRRFEIELLWKRSAYMVGLVIALFVAFGQIAITEDGFIAGIPNNFLLLAISLINSYISFCFARVNFESRKWQRNWEIHANYLHEILGSRLMRVYFNKGKDWFAKWFTIGKINVAIGIFMTLFWLCIFAFLAVRYISGCESIILSLAFFCAIPISILAAHWLSYLFKINDDELELNLIHFDEEAEIFKTNN